MGKPLLLKLPCSMQELHLGITLQCGQSFRWRECQPGRWTGMIKDMVWTLSQDDNTLHCLLHNYTKNRKDPSSPIDHPSPSLVKTKPEFSQEGMKLSNRRQRCLVSQDDPGQILQVKRESSRTGGSRKKVLKTDVDAHSTTAINVTRKLHNSKQPSISIHNCSVEDLKDIHVKDEIDCKADSPLISTTMILSQVNDVETSTKIVDYYTRILHSYFRLDLSLVELYREWSAKDSNFSIVAPSFPGVRMLDQPSVENVFSFICSSNNNIVRISQLVEKLCVHFGEVACDVDGTTWHSFPSIEQLCGQDVEGQLRNLGFGYRASYISQSAQRIAALGGEDWLQSLRLLPHEECRQQLRTLSGVGPKVADCICLMSMNHLSAVPVDTHVFQIAARDYLPELRGVKTVTDKVYRKIADHFRQLYGERAGWAHSVLFSADLKKFISPKKVKSK